MYKTDKQQGPDLQPRNYTQYLVIVTYNRKDSGSLCCTLETNSRLLINYTLIKKKREKQSSVL